MELFQITYRIQNGQRLALLKRCPCDRSRCHLYQFLGLGVFTRTPVQQQRDHTNHQRLKEHHVAVIVTLQTPETLYISIKNEFKNKTKHHIISDDALRDRL